MRNTLEEYGFLMIAVIFVASVTFSVLPLFSDGGSIKDAILEYIATLC